jgi:hypothetical protein
MIAKNLEMLMMGIGGIALKTPLTALKDFRETAEAWRRDEVDVASSRMNDFKLKVEQIRGNNELALQHMELIDKQYRGNVEAKKAALLSHLDDLKMDEHLYTAMQLPWAEAQQAFKQQFDSAKTILDSVDKLTETQVKLAALKGEDAPKNINEVIGKIAANKELLQDEKDPEKRLKLTRKLAMLEDMKKEMLEAELAGKKAGAATTTIKIGEQERKTGAERLAAIQMISLIKNDVAALGNMIGGPWGLNTKVSDIIKQFKRDDPQTKLFNQIIARSDRVTALLQHELTGAAVGANDTNYTRALPDIHKQSVGEFLARLDATEENYRLILDYGEEIRRRGEIKTPVMDRSVPLPVPAEVRSLTAKTAEQSFQGLPRQ